MEELEGALVVRVVDASLIDDGGPVHVVVSGLPEDLLGAVADGVAAAGGRATVASGRLEVVTVASRLVDAAGRAAGAEVADPLRSALGAAIDAWAQPSPDLVTSAGILPCSERTLVMGILNVTPDSFSDGGEHADTDSAVAWGRQMLEEGADIIDVGGESTRPGATPVSSVDELARVLPVVERLASDGAVVSIDTSKAEVARRSVEAGAAIVNDVSAGHADPTMLRVVAALGVPYVAMHAQGPPATMQDAPSYEDVVAEVFEHQAATIRRCVEVGLRERDVIVDPGIGFGKNVEHNLAIMDALAQFRSLGRPILLGASRKSFIGRITGEEDPSQRLAGSLVAAACAVRSGVAIVRVHDVAETVRAVAVAQAIHRGRPQSASAASPAKAMS